MWPFTLLFQVQSLLGQLNSATGELEGVQRAKVALQHWADEALAELNLLHSKPSKMRSDAALQEINHLRQIADVRGPRGQPNPY